METQNENNSRNPAVTPEQIEAMLTRLEDIRRRIAAACEKAGRSTDSVKLMAVTKTVDPVLINAAIDAGIRLLGENRVQEFLSKRESYSPAAEVQFIGRLQTNKIRQIIDKVTLIHAVDSLHLAQAIDREAQKKNLICPVLIEVNIGGELTKGGITPENAAELIKAINELPHLRAEGLMTIPPPVADPIQQEAVFAKMYELRERLREECGCSLDTLSMGMSGDYEAAILHGSTIVRIGSALFGARNYPPKAL